MSGIPFDQSQLWLWIMEYLSSFPEIDVSILNGLLETAPIDNIGESTTERFALRCLEDIFQFVPKNGLGNVAPPDMRVEFDLSLSCSDVLDQILQEVSFSNPRTTEQELLRWDIQPFIKHKRASLPECKLEQMKRLILEEGNNVLDCMEICEHRVSRMVVTELVLAMHCQRVLVVMLVKIMFKIIHQDP